MTANRPSPPAGSLVRECLYVALAGLVMVLVWQSSSDNQAFNLNRLMISGAVAVIGLPLAWLIGRKTGVIRMSNTGDRRP